MSNRLKQILGQSLLPRVAGKADAMLRMAVLFVLMLTSCNGSSGMSAVESVSAYQPIDLHVAGIERGRLVFQQYGCHLCHGANAAKGIKNPNAEGGEILALNRVAEGFRESELKHKILGGVRDVPRAVTNGPVPPYRMPAYHDNMSTQNVDALVSYLFSLMPKDEGDDDW